MSSPTPRAAATVATGNGGSNINLAVPAGTQAGDILVLVVGVGAQANVNTFSCTGGAGTAWTQWLNAHDTGRSAYAGAYGYARVATAADIGATLVLNQSYISTTPSQCVQLVAWQGASGFPKLVTTNDYSSGISGAPSGTATPPLPGLIEPNGTVVGGLVIADPSGTVTAISTGATSIAAQTGASFTAMVQGYNTQAAEGAATAQTISFTLSATATVDAYGFSYLMLSPQPATNVGYRTGTISNNSTATTKAVVVPNDVQVGDLMFLTLSHDVYSSGLPAGWTQLENVANCPRVWTKTAVAGDIGSTITLTLSGSYGAFLELEAFYNWGSYQSTSISSYAAGNATGTTTTLSTPAASIGIAGAGILAFWRGVCSGTTSTKWTPPNYPLNGNGNTGNGSLGTSTDIGGGTYSLDTSSGTIAALTSTWSATPGGTCGVDLIVIAPVSPPLAPTLGTPANASYADLTTPTFSWTPNPTLNDGPQSAVSFEAKVSGASSMSYWNASTGAFQSTQVWFAQTGSSYSFPSGAFANGNIYQWSVATQEATAAQQGPFATPNTITGQAPPAVTVTGPTGTIQTTTPTVTGTISPATGASPASYRVVVYTAAQVAAGGFNPGVTAGVWDSGTVATSSAAIAQPIPANLLSNNVTYYAYAMATETGGEASAWASHAFTVSFDAPQTPLVTATPGTDPGTGAPTITVAVAEADSLLSAVDASVEASLGTHVAETNCTVAPTTGWAADGSQSLQMSATAAGDMAEKTAGGYTVAPNTQYSALATFHAETVARAVKVGIIWKTAAGAEISRSYGATVNDTTSSSGAQATVTATSPSNAAEADIVAYVVAAAGAGEKHDVDCYGIFPGTVTTWSRGGLTGSTTIDVWARTSASSATSDAQRPAGTGIRVAAGLVPDSSQHASWTDWAAASGVVYEYQAVVNGPGGIATPSAWTA